MHNYQLCGVVQTGTQHRIQVLINMPLPPSEQFTATLLETLRERYPQAQWATKPSVKIIKLKPHQEQLS